MDGLVSTEKQFNVEKSEVDLQSLSASEENNRIRINRQQAEADLLGMKQRLVIDTNITLRMDNLLQQGAISKLEVDRQHERLSELQSTVKRAELEVASARRRELEGAYKYNHIGVADAKQLYTTYDNARQNLIDANNRIKDSEERLRLSHVRAPSTGVIFDLNARVGEMAVSIRPLLKIVPKSQLTADIRISDKDIGWIKIGMPVEVRVNSFPFTEYGSIKGVLLSISDDIYQPDNLNPQEYFKGKVKLNKSVLSHNGIDYSLRSGMAITALVQVGSRPAISLVSDRFTSFIDSAKSIR
jgi:HlyD family secretion protein